MEDQPIIDSGEMVRAIRDRRKTQTRRVVKPQPTPEPDRAKRWGGTEWYWESNSGKTGIFYPHRFKGPYGFPGNHLWVREAFRIDHAFYIEGRRAVHPQDPQRRMGFPRVHGGRIGSSGTLWRDPKIRARLSDAHGVMAVEMEGSGMDVAAWTMDKPNALVSGTSEYWEDKDKDENKIWRPEAALAAACVVRAMVETMPEEWITT